MKAYLLGSAILGPVSKQRKWFKKLLNLTSLQIRKKDLLIGVDGGTQVWRSCGFEPDFAVGDWDSLPEAKQVLSKIPHLTLPSDKNRSDLFYGMICAQGAGAKEIVCLGVTGGRPDHQLAALYDLSFFSTGAYGRIHCLEARGLEGDYYFLSEKIPYWRRSLPPGTLVSVFPIGGPAEGVSLRGFQFNLKNSTLFPSSHGLSNQVVKKNCEVSLRKGQLLVIIPRNGFD